MKVLLRDYQTGFYFSTSGKWVSNASSAFDFKTVEAAGKRAFESNQEGIWVILSYEDPICELAINPAFSIEPGASYSRAYAARGLSEAA